MPEPTDPQPLPPNIETAGTTVFSPSPVPGQPSPMRRADDNLDQTHIWIALGVGILGWASTFCIDMASYNTFAEIWTPKFLGVHIGQLFSVTLSIVAARRLK